MKFHSGVTPEDSAFHPEATGRKPLREPNPVLMQVFAIPVAVASAGVTGQLWHLWVPLSLSGRSSAFESAATLCVLLFIIPVHDRAAQTAASWDSGHQSCSSTRAT